MPAASSPKKAFLVSHTHWDREWYLPFHTFRVSLVRIVGEILDRLESDESFRHFVLDGQARVLEDHLEVRPEDRDRILRLVTDGALSIGPWYILPDEFLVSGESTVRNLLVGDEVCAPLGGAQKVGYMPDSFGHVAQMPQLLRRAGIDSFIYTRGNGDEIEGLGHEFRWAAPDGSEVLAINQCGGYCSAGGLGFEELWHAHTSRVADAQLAVAQIRDLFVRMARLSNGDVYLVNNGCDHLPPQQRFGEILEALREALPETEFLHTGFGEYLEEVRSAGFARKRFEGELLGGRHHLILSGVWSARMYVKQMNERSENLLARLVEPVCSYTRFLVGREYPGGLIGGAWKLLLTNHPHDSICGCSTDEVHREMVSRFDGVIQTGEQLLKGELGAITPMFARSAEDDRDTVLTVLNPLPERRTEVVERLVVLQPFGFDTARLALFDEEGRRVPFEVVDRIFVERFWGIDYRSELTSERQHAGLAVYLDRFGDRMVRSVGEKDESDCYLTIRFTARDLPALGHARYFLREADERPAGPSGGISVGEGRLENEHVSVHSRGDGTFDLLDKATGLRYERLGRLVDTEDVGDEYDHSPAPESLTVTSEGAEGRVSLVAGGRLRATLQAAFALELPAAIEPDRSRRAKKRVQCAVRTRVTLERGSSVVGLTIEVSNRAEDHLLRAEFRTPLVTDTVVSDGQFLVHRRPIAPPEGRDWVQPPPGTVPQQEFSALEDGEKGLAVLNRGLPEIRAFHDEAGRAGLAVTLLRSVGWLSRDDFESRKRQNAGPTLYTPDAQCPGEHRFSLAVLPYSGDWLAADVKGHSARFRCPVLVAQGVEDGSEPGGRWLFERGTRKTAVSAVKRHRTRDTLVVRIVNLSSEPITESLTFGLPVRAAWRTGLLEEREGELPLAPDGTVALPLGPFEISTVEVQFHEGGGR